MKGMSVKRAVTLGVALMFAWYGGPISAQKTVATSATPDRDVKVADELLSRRVSLDVTAVPLKQVIEMLGESAHVIMQYNAYQINHYNIPITAHFTRVPMGAALEHILSQTPFTVLVDGPSRLSIVDATVSGAKRDGGTITGVVVNATTKHPVRGASVVLDDSVAAVRTDEAGRYRLVGVTSGTHRVTVRFVGFARQSKTVIIHDEPSVTVDFALESSVNTLDQVVVTATGAQRYRELGHVVTVLNADSLVKEAPITTVSDLLQSRVPGLQVQTLGGGVVGGPVKLQLRGQSSLNLSAEPIVIVDGVRYKSTSTRPDYSGPDRQDTQGFQGIDASSPLNDLNVNDIATVEVVKGPSASTLYGPDAANGVIVITTKRGQGTKTNWNWYARPLLNSVPASNGVATDGITVWSHATNDTIDRKQFFVTCQLQYQYYLHACIIDSVTKGPSVYQQSQLSTLGSNKPSWQYGSNVSGGTPALRYYLSGDYLNQLGNVQVPPIVQQLLVQQMGLSSVSDAMRHPNTLQNIGAHGSVTATPSSTTDLTAIVDYRQIDNRRASPSVFLNDQALAALPAGATGLLGDSLTDQYVLDKLYRVDLALANDESQDQRLGASVQGTWHPASWLTGSALMGLDLDVATDHSVRPGSATNSDGYSWDTRRNSVGRTGTVNLTATKSSSLLNFRTSTGVNYIYSKLDGVITRGSGIAPGSTSLSLATSVSGAPDWEESAELGWYVQEVIGVNDQLFLDAGLRMDGTTRTGERYHAAALPKLGLSWIASDAPFLRGHLPGITELRLRASAGSATRYPTTFMQLGTLGSQVFPLWGQNVVGFSRNGLADPTLRPEVSHEFETGADATVFGGITLGASWWRRRTHDELLWMQLPDGIPGTWGNLGRVVQHGFEATANVPVLRSQRVMADVQFLYSHQTSKVASFGDQCTGCIANGGYWLGYPTDAIFDYRTVAVIDSVGGGPDSVYENGEKIRSTDQKFYGVRNPPTTMTLTPQIELWHGLLRLSSVFERETGFTVEDYTTRFCMNSLTCAAPFFKSTPVDVQAKLTEANPWDFYVPGDFTRWREFTMTVDVPRSWLRLNLLHVAFSHASVSLQGRNLVLWTRNKTVDPESATSLTSLVAGGGIPQTRTWGFRFDVTP